MDNQLEVALYTAAGMGVLAVVLYYSDRLLSARALVKNATLDGAKAALERLADWAKWMSGIQTAALGGISLLLDDKCNSNIKDEPATAVTVVLLGAALFCSAWILSALSSITLRVIDNPKQVVSSRYDVYAQPLYGFTSITLSYILSLQHWLWAGGLLSFGWFLSKL